MTAVQCKNAVEDLTTDNQTDNVTVITILSIK